MGNFAVLLIDVCGAASTSEKLVDYVSTMIGLRAGFLAFKAFHEDSSWVCAMLLTLPSAPAPHNIYNNFYKLAPAPLLQYTQAHIKYSMSISNSPNFIIVSID